ncbi:hypothetical protein NEOLEDRAFT_1154530 [Neolentinus lepideus HHB14362 ss-1]|uniref:BTB domain-containing protein n=1 Tax=Neolentinus lepideus HHB14362 ss-1 TaxID=1314782 RepID=A0A165UIM8_9AGAM|nr:hypothetical protein NEOLEDRAFT_1154530 [Neolentinus lepideus HHB14362 ss-1]
MIRYEITDAKTPFDDQDADVIVRSGDGVDFRVFRVVLMLASPVFKDTLRLPRPAKSEVKRDPEDEERDGLPVLRIQERSSVFETLLRFCYPQVEDPEVSKLEDIVDTLGAALKYDLEIIAKRMKQLLLQPKFLGTDPIYIYAIACQHRLREHAEVAARFSLRTPMLQHASKGLDLISGLEYHRLLIYHRRCADVASAVAEDLDMLSPNYIWLNCRNSTCASVPSMCPGSLSSTMNSPRKWWVDFMAKLRVELLRRPCGDTVLDTTIRKEFLNAAARCPTCKPQAGQDLAHFCKVLGFTVDNEIIDNVFLELSF